MRFSWIRMIRRAWPSLVVMLGALLLLPGTASANLDCNVGQPILNFGSVDVNSGTPTTATGSVSFTCTNWNTSATKVWLCMDLGSNVSYPGTVAQPVMNGPSRLNFQMYRDAALSQVWVKTVAPLQLQFTVPGPTYVNYQPTFATYTGNFTFYGAIPAGQTGAQAGNYTATFWDTVVGFQPNGVGQCQERIGGDLSGRTLQVDVRANAGNKCTVAATPVNFGSAPPTGSMLEASGTITVKCPNQTAYNVGLLPSNGNVNGVGGLRGTGSNTDVVPYQLRRDGAAGTAWGNTATPRSVGNGVAGTGNGNDQAIPVYATVQSTSYRADTYSDTVTVFVYY